MTTQVKCAICSEVFTPDWTDEEASLEFQQNFPGQDIRNADLVCDDCYQQFISKEQ